MTFLLVIAAVTVATLLSYFVRSILQRGRRGNGLPPGPAGWPVIGNMALMAGPLRHQKILTTGKQYGGIYSARMGAVTWVIVTSYKHFREAVVDQAWEFSDRPRTMWFSDETTDNHPGILASGIDETSRNVRKFSLVTLRSFGFGKTSMQTSILQQCQELIDELRKHAGKPINPTRAIGTTSANVIASMAFGKTYKQGDGELLAVMNELTTALQLVFEAYKDQVFPFLKYIPFLSSSRKLFNNCFITAKRFVVEIVNQHITSREPGNPRDFVDVWLDEHSKDKDSATNFPLERLPNVLLDFFGGGFETTTIVFQWLIAILLHYPDIQAKIHEELDGQTDSESQVTLECRDHLPYTESVILETLRMYPPASFSATHMAAEDAKLAGFLLPKGTQLFLHLYSILNDPDLWTDPEVFRPERFILDGSLKVPEYFVPFGAGRRSCIAEQLARKELFLIFANIMVNFRLSIPEGSRPPSLEITENALTSIRPFDVFFEAR